MVMMRVFRTLKSALIFAIGGIFLVLAAIVALLSSNVYRGVSESSEENFSQRTVLSYVANQVRAADIEGGVAVGQFGGSDAVVLTEGEYHTVLYYYDGWLMELYTEAELGLGPEDGTQILEVESLDFSIADGKLLCSAVHLDGTTSEVVLRPNCGVTEVGEI